MTSSDAAGRTTGRYAPSPTGSLHLGNLRTALAASLRARSLGGRFLLRIEDIDRPRTRPGMAERHLRDLQLLGIEWDEEPLRQSERGNVYGAMLEKLKADGHAYPCFCSRRDIQLALSAPHAEDRVQGYPGTCRALPAEKAALEIEAGKACSWRVRVDDSPREFDDLFHGRVAINLEHDGGDFVVSRADGMPAYQLVCAVDDALSGVTEVLRGDDLLDSAARQAWVLRLLGLPLPQYCHIPLMLGANGARLSKRAGADDLERILAQGLDAIAVRSYLAWTLGQCETGERPAMEQLAARFDLAKVPRAPVAFDPEAMARFRR